MAELELNVRPEGAERGARRAENALDGVKRSAVGAEAQLDRTSRSARAIGRAFTIAGAAVVASAAAFAARSIPAYRAQNAALAEVSTLIEGTVEEIEALDNASQRFAAQFGGSATQQVEAFYQAISAGVGDVEDATDFLASANVLAQAGVTDITTSVDALSSALNAYASEGLSAAEASDILFSGVRAGKTTLDELGSSLGNVIPIASSVGVGLDEVVAATAALTTQGQSTSIAVTGIRQVLASVLKPTKEAADLAAELGIEFDVAALKSKGLADFIADIAERTGGSQEALAQLFGSVEALNAVLALTGDAGDVLDSTLADIAVSAGITQEAAEKVGQSLDQRLNRQLAILSNAGLRVGEALLSVLVPALEAVTSAFQNITPFIEGATVVLAGLVASQIPAAATAIGTLATSFSLYGIAATGAATATGILTTALTVLGGPIGIAAALIGAAGAAWLVYSRNTETATTSTYDAAAAEAALNGELDVFFQTTAPQSAQKALELARAREQQAKTAFDAAAAEVALQRAELESLRASDPGFGVGVAQQVAVEERILRGRIEALEGLQRELDAARAAVTSTQELIVGGGAGTFSPTLPEIRIPKVELDLDLGRAPAAISQLETEFEGLLDTLDQTDQATKEYNASIDLLSEAIAAGIIERGPEADAVLGQIEDQFRRAKIENDALGQSASRTFSSIIRGANSASDALGNLLDQVANTALTSGLNGIFGGLFGGIGSALGFNAGGTNYFAGGATVVGEQGPETVFLPRGSQIMDNDTTRRLAGRDAPINVSVAVNVDARNSQSGVGSEIAAIAAPIIREQAVLAVKDAQRRGR